MAETLPRLEHIARFGLYVNLKREPDGDLKLELTPEGREADFSHRTGYHLYDYLEDHLCNGWDLIEPEAIGALTSAPILGWDVSRDDDQKVTAVGELYWFPNYAILDPVEEMLADGFVIFDKAPVEK